MNEQAVSPTRFTYVGLFFISLATLTHQVLLTRIFSVTMWYHFAFMAISLAMFGLAAGAVLIEVLPKKPADELLARTALLFAATSAICFVSQLYIEVNPEREILTTAD